MRFLLLLLLLLLQAVQGLHRGQNAGSLPGKGLRRLQMNNNDDVTVDDSNMGGGGGGTGTPPGTPPPDTPAPPPTTPPPFTYATGAPIVPPTSAPIWQPISLPTEAPVVPPVPEPTDAPVDSTDESKDESPTDAPKDKDRPTDVPAASPTDFPTDGSTPTTSVDLTLALVDFVVTTDATNIPKLTTSLETFLALEFAARFKTAESVSLAPLTFDGRRLMQDVVYSGTVTFSDFPVPTSTELHAAQEAALMDPVLEVGEIQLLQQQESPSSPPSGAAASIGLIAGIAVGAGVAIGAAIYIGYRYFSTSTPPIMEFVEKDPSNHGSPKQGTPNTQPSSTREMDAPDDGDTTLGGIEIDDYSLAGESLADSTAKSPVVWGPNATEVYLANRQKQKQTSLLGSSFDSESEFSYANVGKGGKQDKGMVSDDDDDLYLSDYDGVEISMDGGAYVQGSSVLGVPLSGDESLPFDERPFDEQVKPKPPVPPKEKSRFSKSYFKKAKEDEDKSLEQEQATLSPTSNSTGAEEEGEDLSEFLRERRRAKRASRKNRESRKQPPIAMEV